MTYNSAGRSVEVLSSVPEVGLERRIFIGPSAVGKGIDIMMFSWMKKKPFMGFFLKAYTASETKEGKQHKDMFLHLNVTANGIAWEIYFNRSRVEAHPQIDADYDASFTYYCSKDRPLFYIFHMNPLHAAENGDITQIKMKNSAKMTTLSTEPSRWTADDSFSLNYPGQTVSMVTDMQRTENGAHRNSVITYLRNEGETATVTMKADVADHSVGEDLDFDYNLKIEADDFDVVMDGKVTGSSKDFSLHMDTNYNKVENESRKKRSLTKIYEKFKELEKTAVNKLIEVEEAILRKPETQTRSKAEDTGTENTEVASLKFPPMPLFPSIWDIPKWTANVDLKGEAKPIFGPTPGPPKAMEFVWTVDVTHPWRGGYRTNAQTGKAGKNMKNNIQNFHYWFELGERITYTDLDGATVEIPEVPNPLDRSAHFHIQRESGHNFDVKLEAKSPLINFVYLILFDWEAIGHHQPLFHVKSSQSSRLFSIFNHDYEEFFTYEPGHIKHTATFHHKYHSISLDTNVDFVNKEINGFQNGTFSVDMPAFGIGKSYDFSNVFEMKKAPGYPRLVSTFVPASNTDRSLVYKFVLEHPKAISVKHYVQEKPDISEHLNLWQARLELQGSSTLQYTFQWFDVYDKTIQQLTLSNLYQLTAFLQHIAENMKKDMGFAIVDKNFILTYHDAEKHLFRTESPRYILKTYILPKIILINSMVENVVSNFVLLKYRQALMNQPGPYVPPRFRLLLQSSQFRNKVPSSGVVQVIERLTYYGAKISVPLVYKAAGRLQEFLQNTPDHKAIVALPLPFVKDSFMFISGALNYTGASLCATSYYLPWAYNASLGGALVVHVYSHPDVTDIKIDIAISLDKSGYQHLPRPREATKLAVSFLRQMMERYTEHPITAGRMAIVFGREGQDRPLNIMTFDGITLQIPADRAGVCSYLLMADITRKNATVIVTPAGLSLITSDTAVTLGYDKNVYVNDCKIPLNTDPHQQLLNGVSLDVQQDNISVSTEHGLSLTCYRQLSDVCIISWSGSNLNGTIGLLGTNDLEGYTDRRKPDGTMADTSLDLVSKYAVSGPAECYRTSEPKPETRICNEELHTKCLELFDMINAPYRSCRSYLDSTAFMHACLEEGQRCDSTEEDICHAYLAYSHLCEKANLDPALVGELGTCKTVPEAEAASSSGSLDIVFIVSQHSSMATDLEPWEYMFELLSLDMELPFDEVRVGVVGFAGLQELHAPYVLKQDDSYFTELDDFDWTAVESLHAEGTEIADGFEAINLAASFPFSPTSHKMIVLLMTKEQGLGVYSDVDAIQDMLVNKGIILNVFSTYAKLSSKKVIGIDWESRVISRRKNLQQTKALPQNDYIKLIKATKGAVFDILTISRGREPKIERILEYFILQTQQHDQSVCPAA